MMNCADKFLKHSERVGARFAEQNAGAQCRTLRNLFFKLITIHTAEAMNAAASQK
jgi:hypothetical protein